MANATAAHRHIKDKTLPTDPQYIANRTATHRQQVATYGHNIPNTLPKHRIAKYHQNFAEPEVVVQHGTGCRFGEEDEGL